MTVPRRLQSTLPHNIEWGFAAPMVHTPRRFGVAIRITCPSCRAAYTVDDGLRGKKIRCKKCEEVFAVQPARGADHDDEESPRSDRRIAAKPVPKAPVRAPRDEEEDERPARKPARARDDDEETPERRPPSRVRPSRDEDDAPRRRPSRDDDERPIRKKKIEKQGMSTGLLVGIGGGALVFVGLLIGGVVFALNGSSKPTNPQVAQTTPLAQGGPVAQGNVPPPPVVNPPVVPEEKPAPPAMDGAIPLAIVEQIKDATAFIKMDAGQLSGSGSGFVMRVDGDTAYLVTNDHVVTPPSKIVVPIGRLRQRVVNTPKARITVVLRSGTSREQSLTAEVMATDAEADLAVLKVAGVRDLPKPIDFGHRAQLAETMPLFIFGFPFGSALGGGKGNPAITVGRGTVSSLRLDDRGGLAVVQINGDLNPGNSGGPVVDSKGRLIGVSVAAIKGTQIGMAIPAAELSQMLRGRVLGTAVVRKKIEGDAAQIAGEIWMLDRLHKVQASKALNLRIPNVAVAGKAEGGDIEIEAKLLDPLRRIKSVSLHYAPTTAPPAALPNAQGLWDPLPAATTLALKIEEQKAVTAMSLPAGTAPDAPFTFQISYVNGDGTTAFTQPRSIRLVFNATAPQVPIPGGGKYGPDNTVVVRITNVKDANSRRYVLDRLPALIGGNSHSVRSSSIPDGVSATIAPVTDPKAFADKIDFGTVTSIQGRVIHVTAKKLDVPPADADVVTLALFDMRSPSALTRKAAIAKLIELGPNDRRAEVAKALEKLIADSDSFVRQEALKALGVWGTKDNLPEMGKALAHEDVFTRKAALEALGKIKDEAAADLIAARLVSIHERGDASKALQAMGPLSQKAAVKYIKHTDWMVRLEVCKVLKAVGTKQSAPALLTATKDTNGIVARAAREAHQFAAARK